MENGHHGCTQELTLLMHNKFVYVLSDVYILAEQKPVCTLAEQPLSNLTCHPPRTLSLQAVVTWFFRTNYIKEIRRAFI